MSAWRKMLMTETPDAFVLDTSAVLALWNEEDGASAVE
jgi:hypothetical protein